MLNSSLAQALQEAAAAAARQQWEAAAASYGQAAALAPWNHQLVANQANALWLADRPHQALDPYRRAVQLAPGDPVAYRGLGNVYTDLQAFEAADRAYGISIALEPQQATLWNRSQVLIGLERYAEGYELAEARWQLPTTERYRDPQTAWRGEPEGFAEPLCVWSEQGLGDTLQHLRWLGPLVARRRAAAQEPGGVAPLLLEVEPCLVGLLQEGLQALGPGIAVQAKPSDPAPVHRHVSLLSLPLLLGGAPWPPEGAALSSPAWRPPRQSAFEAPRIGLVWAAGRKLEEPVSAREYWRRSLDDEALGTLITGLASRGARCVLLQFGDDRERADPWRPLAAGTLPDRADFRATAALVAELDLVITVDTAMAHLVGAMQRPGWVLLPFSAAPRWLRQRSDSPWYPTLRLFRQPRPGDWRSVVREVLEALELLQLQQPPHQPVP
jgi:hypothetical protein